MSSTSGARWLSTALARRSSSSAVTTTAANSFREALNGDLEPKWIEVWCHINLGRIYDVLGQRERALGEYQKAVDTNDDSQGAQEVAQKHIKEPYKYEGNREVVQ